MKTVFWSCCCCWILLVKFDGIVGHDEYRGKCPTFPPMDGFNWDRFSKGLWYVTEKFDTTDSRCFTYKFSEDENGFKMVVQNSELTDLKRLAIDNKFRYRGRISSPRSSQPADMIVRFPLNILGPSSFVVMDTDYSTYALICTCQSKKIFFDFLTFHRRSCSILQRSPNRDIRISSQMKALLNDAIPSEEGSQKADHDFDIVDQKGCNYDDKDKGFQIDVDKIIDAAEDEITEVISGTIDVVDDIASVITKKGNDDDNRMLYEYDGDYIEPGKSPNPRV